MSIIPEVGKLSQKDHEFKPILGYITRLPQKNYK
jgi:hypothetical protein